MKKTIFLLLIIAIVSCKEEQPKNYATLSGKITNQNSDSLVVRTRTYSKTLKVAEDGTFSDTLKVETGIYNLYDGTESTSVFLKNGVDINVTLDTKAFDETVAYTGEGSETSNYLAKKALLQETSFTSALFDEEEDAFKAKVDQINDDFLKLLNSYKGLDSSVVTIEKMSLTKMPEGLLNAYKQQQERAKQMKAFEGKPSPKFVSYENHKGGTTSLADLKGKYVYVDVWATWCGPCKREIPFLKEVEGKYHDKNIEFVSVSVDQKRDYEKWKAMVTEKELGGIQLFADNDWKSSFVQEYQIKGIPRFILIDPDGNIVSADAPRPSSPKLIELFEELKI